MWLAAHFLPSSGRDGVITGFRRELDNGGYRTLMMYTIPALLYVVVVSLSLVLSLSLFALN